MKEFLDLFIPELKQYFKVVFYQVIPIFTFLILGYICFIKLAISIENTLF